MILLISNTNDFTTDFVVRSLRKRVVNFFRLNTDEIGSSTGITLDFSASSYRIIDRRKGDEINLDEVKSVYFRRPEYKSKINLSVAEDTFVKSEFLALLDGLYACLNDRFWVSHPVHIRIAEDKIYQLLVARELGSVKMPEAIITSETNSALSFFRKQNEDCIIKPMRVGFIPSEPEYQVVFTSRITLDEENVLRIKSLPIFLQNHIAKKADIRVTVVGNRIFAAKINSQTKRAAQTDWRMSATELVHEQIILPAKVADFCLHLLKRLSLNFGAIDFILTNEDEFIFLEINPNGQWAWIENKLKYPIADEIANILVHKSN